MKSDPRRSRDAAAVPGGGGGLLLTVQVTAKLVPPNLVRGHNKVTLRVPGLGRCRSEPSNVSWYARHR